MGKFEVGQEVILLDGTSLIGRVIAVSETASVIVAYKVATEGTTGRWYSADELAPYITVAPPQADEHCSEFNRGWEAATRSMLDILERALDQPKSDVWETLNHIEELVKNFRKQYPKHAQGQGE